MAVMVMQHVPMRAVRRAPPRGLVVSDPRPDELGGEIDWSSWFLTDEEDMAHAPEHNEAARIFYESTLELARERGWERDRIAADEFFAWVEEQPLVRVSPDVFVQSDPPPRPWPRVWSTWQPGHHPPRFALEIVSADWKKDYEGNPPKYWQLGVRELVIFDPEARGATRLPLQIYRRAADGALVRVYAGAGPAESAELGVWLVVVRADAVATLRLAQDPEGKNLVPTESEARGGVVQARLEADQARFEADRARLEAEQAYDLERHARAAAEEELAILREQLARRG